jgi:DNA-binding GntR family transcriptional regulator
MGAAERETMLELRRQLDQIGSTQGPELDRYLDVEWQMHEVCYGACQHERMLREIRSFRHQAERYFRLALVEGMNLRDDLQQQHDFCQACVAGDAKEAERMAVKLLDWTVERVAPVLAESGAMPTAT